ncbi:translation initiation factor eif-2b subunit delta [Lasius niger]|uniref:Translation initiation factor eIF2B subunit delta n=1 Tax=Lasius niger TaxID=67767 RepID=A0A0J7KR12_LASNI|nr:translation initiation factor eif-2b subunit delta [Lasius niger]
MNFPQKTREEVKAEREAKKAAKAAAKTSKGKSNKVANNNVKTNCKISEKNVERDVARENVNKVAETNIKSKPLAAGCDISEKSTKIDADTTVRDSQPTRDVSEENANPSSNVATQDCASAGKSKAELRAERRAKQEAQRAAKQQQLLAKDNTKTKEPVKPHVETISECAGTKDVKKSAIKEDPHQLSLFKHLYHERESSRIDLAPVNSSIHPAIVRLGVRYASKVIVGSNARCVALLAAVKQVVEDFEKPAQADFVRGLETCLKKSLAYLHHCRPLAVSQQNAMRHLKLQMTRFSSLSDENVKNKLQGMIDTYISEQIQLADKAISITIREKISNGNVILTYGYSSLIQKILVEAHAAGKQFRVIVVDGRPWLEGKEQLRRLVKHGIECSYILINALSFIMPEVSKVFLGAHAILANGAVMSRAGTAQVALIAKAFNVPVLVACETHKSSGRVLTDSIVYNELGNADELVNHQSNDKSKKSLLSNWRTKKSLNLLNITYDVTPADLVTAVVTELGILPCTSVPVILRIKPSEI